MEEKKKKPECAASEAGEAEIDRLGELLDFDRFDDFVSFYTLLPRPMYNRLAAFAEALGVDMQRVHVNALMFHLRQQLPLMSTSELRVFRKAIIEKEGENLD